MLKYFAITLTSALLIDIAQTLQVSLTKEVPTFCMLAYQDRVVTGFDSYSGQPESRQLKMSDAMEIHYSVSGVNQDRVLFSVYKQERLPNNRGLTEQKQIHSSKG